MIERVKLKKGDVIVVNTKNSLSTDAAEAVVRKFKEAFPDNEVMLPNGAEIFILERA
jgi:hypothetical protein